LVSLFSKITIGLTVKQNQVNLKKKVEQATVADPTQTETVDHKATLFSNVNIGVLVATNSSFTPFGNSKH
jgi:hypothetical protein